MAEIAFAPNPDRAIASLRNPSRVQTGLLTDDWISLSGQLLSAEGNAQYLEWPQIPCLKTVQCEWRKLRLVLKLPVAIEITPDHDRLKPNSNQATVAGRTKHKERWVPMDTLDKIWKLVPWVAGAFLILFLTPIGGIVRVIVGIGGLIGAGALLVSAIFSVSDNPDFKTAGIKCLWAVALVALSLLAIAVLPSLPKGWGSDICWDGRSNPRC